MTRSAILYHPRPPRPYEGADGDGPGPGALGALRSFIVPGFPSGPIGVVVMRTSPRDWAGFCPRPLPSYGALDTTLTAPAGLNPNAFPLGLMTHLHTQAIHAAETLDAGVAPYRTLSPEGGWRRILCWGDFRHLLEAELAHPERLQDSHRLACSVEVHEVLVPMTRQELERGLRRQGRPAVRLEPLTRDLVLRLGLAAVLPPVRRSVRPAPRRDEDVIPFERFLELHVLDDPTRSGEPARRPSKAEELRAPVREAARTVALPANWVRPWEFRLSREDVLYDMNTERTWWGRIRRGVRRITGLFSARAALGKWKALLTGKPVSEQLWGVRPPREVLTHPGARRWVAEALAAAGYDPTRMLSEWEIFWRRKGV